MGDLTEFFAFVREEVDAELERLVPENGGPASELSAAMRWSLFSGGKRFRPALVYAVGRLFEADDDRLATTAAAIEMMHTYSLIHDDLPSMDDDDMRRGRLTCHKKFGEATAVLAGDALQALSFSTIAEEDRLSADARLSLLNGLGRAAQCMVTGQFLDLESEGGTISIDEIRTIHVNKTGALIEFATRSGAVIAGATDRDIAAIDVFASRLGLLFQITDDILDVVQPSSALGKTAGKDAVSGKATYVSELGVEGAKELAEMTEGEAVIALEGLDRDSGLLKAMAEYVLERGS